MPGYAVLLAFELCGLVTADALARKHCGLLRAWLGLCIGLMLMMWTPIPFALLLRFTRGAQLLGLGLSVLIAALCALRMRSAPRTKQPFTGDMPVALAPSLLIPLLLLGAYLMATHYIRAAADGSLHCGQSTYGDSPLHLGIATGCVNAAFPPDYTILKGTLLGYPFLADTMVSTLLLFGTDLSAGFVVTGTIMLVCVFTGFLLLAWELTHRTLSTVLAWLLLLFNGGFGFAYALDGAMTDPSAFLEIFTGFYKTPTNLTSLNIRWVNLLCDMLIPQRTFLCGWMVLLPALWLLVRAMQEKRMRQFVLLGVWAGLMPMVHTHSFVALALFSAAGMLCGLMHAADRTERIATLKGWLTYAGIACVLAIPQLLVWSVPQTVNGGSLTLYFNWANNNGRGGLNEEYFWFWIKNVGPVYLLMLPAALNAPKRSVQRTLALGALIIYTIAELIRFQPNPYDNNKLFYAAFMVMLPAVGALLSDLWDRLKGIRGRCVLAVAFLIVCTLSGALTIGREIVSDYQLFSANDVEAAEWIRENTPEHCVFLTADNHNNTVAALTGRYIVCGTGSYLYFHGLDYGTQQADARLMLEEPAAHEALLRQYDVSYVYISDSERYDYRVDESWFAEHATAVFRNDSVTIYALTDPA